MSIILNDHEMSLARELAKELTDINRKKELMNSFEKIHLALTGMIQEVKENLKDMLDFFMNSSTLSATSTIDDRPRLHVPVKVIPPPMPDFELPKLHVARSNL